MASGRLLYAVTPRFALSTSDAMLEMCQTPGPRAPHHPRPVPHQREPRRDRGGGTAFSWAGDYLAVYERYSPVGARTVLAHNVHATDGELERLAEAHASIAHCPASNAALGSGIFPFAASSRGGRPRCARHRRRRRHRLRSAQGVAPCVPDAARGARRNAHRSAADCSTWPRWLVRRRWAWSPRSGACVRARPPISSACDRWRTACSPWWRRGRTARRPCWERRSRSPERRACVRFASMGYGCTRHDTHRAQCAHPTGLRHGHRLDLRGFAMGGRTRLAAASICVGRGAPHRHERPSSSSASDG